MKTYSEAVHEPLTTQDQLERRVRDLVGNAIRPQLWLMFLDIDAVQLPLLIPIDGLPARPDSTERFASSVIEMVRITDAAAIVLVIERPGPAELSELDVEWAQALRGMTELASVPLRGILLSHDTGVMTLEQ